MFSRLLNPYKGLSSEIWYLAFITLVNRAGAMVIPFLSLYLNKHLHFSYGQVGWIMSSFGVGSALGTFTGGKLTDRIGYQKVMISSLFLTGIFFFGIQYLSTFESLLVGIFVLSFTADTYRPAIWVAMDAYSNKKNRTRSVTLIRLAINLGFAVGPAAGGFIIANLSYSGLFWIDGLTCITASLLLWSFLVQKKKRRKLVSENEKITGSFSPYKDIPYLMFFVAIMLMGTAFMQFFSTMPIYFDTVIGMSEQEIGLLIAGNGALIFLFEMPMIHYLEKKKRHALFMTIMGSVLIGMTFIVLNISTLLVFPILAMVFLTFGEMISFPFSNSFAMQRSDRGKKGEYMAIYTLTFSFAYIIGPNLGMQISNKYGFDTAWYAMAFIMSLSIAILIYLHNKLKLENK